MKILKEDYIQNLKNRCASCNKEFSNSWSHYLTSGNYCSVCCGLITHLGSARTRLAATEYKCQIAPKPLEQSLRFELNTAKREFEDAKANFAQYAELEDFVGLLTK